MNQGTCKACGAPILWIRTRAGKSMPCDVKPLSYVESQGAPQKIVTAAGDVLSCELVEEHKTNKRGYLPHWATCPNADSFRRKK